MGLSLQELLILAIFLVIAVAVGKNVAWWLPNELRKTIGGIALLIGGCIAIYGIINANEGGFIVISFGILVGVIGISALSTKGRSDRAGKQSSTRKCPYCAETIQAEAKICRFCGKESEPM